MTDEERGVQVLDPHPNGSDGGQPAAPEASVVTFPAAEPAAAAPSPPSPESSAIATSTERRRRRPWVVPTAIGVAGLIVSGALGGLLVSTTGQRDSARHHLAVTQTALTSTRHQLDAAQSDIAARKATEKYSTIWISDGGQLLTDYETLAACKAYSDCRTIAQQTLADLQTYQSDRNGAIVPAALQSADGMLRDSLSAAIAATQELIAGMDNDDVNKVKDGATKLDDAMLSVGKAESALAKGLA